MTETEYLTLNLLTATLAEARKAAEQQLGAVAETARNMYAGFHLGKPIGIGTDYSYWKGPLPPAMIGGSEAEQRAHQAFLNEFQTALDRSFTSSNMVKVTLRREIGSSLAGMNWTLMQPTFERQTAEERSDLEQEADALATRWWKTAGSHPEKAIRAAMLTARREGRGVLRFRVAAGALTKYGTVKPSLDMSGLTKYIRLENIQTPENVRIWEDADTFEQRAIFSYSDMAGKDAAEICTVQDDLTTLRVLKVAGSTSVTLDLGGRSLYLELLLEPLITAQVLQNQMAYNTASTMILRNTELAGFIERYGVNLEPPFDLVPDPEQPTHMVRKYKAVTTGAASLNLWRSATYDKVDGQGNYVGEESLGSGTYGRFEPVSPESLTAAAQHNKMNLYDEVGQSYVLMGSDATASGRSREVAIADFDTIRAPVIELGQIVIGQVLETFLALVSALAGKPGHFAEIAVTGQVKSKIVPPSSLERAADLADAEAGIISAQTARQRQGVENPEQEDAQIKREKEAGTSPTVLSKPAPTPIPAASGGA